jgi:alkylated DNA repair protein alkB family protein 8
VLVPWKLRGEEERVFQRYYHVFEEGELEHLVSRVEGLRLLHSYYDQGNWCILAQKL